MSMTLKTTKNLCFGLSVVFKITTRRSTIDVRKKSDLSRKNRTTGPPGHVRKISDQPQPVYGIDFGSIRFNAPGKNACSYRRSCDEEAYYIKLRWISWWAQSGVFFLALSFLTRGSFENSRKCWRYITLTTSNMLLRTDGCGHLFVSTVNCPYLCPVNLSLG